MRVKIYLYPTDGNDTAEDEFVYVTTPTVPPPPPIPTCSLIGMCHSCPKDIIAETGNQSRFFTANALRDL